MDLSIFLAKLLGVLYTAAGLGLLFDPDYYQDLVEEMMDSYGSVYLGGVTVLIAGVSIIIFHNQWEASWKLIITIIGWIGAIKGVGLIAFPRKTKKFYRNIVQKEDLLKFWGVFSFTLGLVLIYFGYFV